MNEVERWQGADWAMRRVMAECHRRGFLPLVLIAGDGEQVAVMPCGPNVPEQRVWELLADVVARHAEARRVTPTDPLLVERKGDC